MEWILSIVSGVVASVVFMLVLLLVKPRIKIAPKMCQDPDENFIYRIKVTNKSFAVLNNVFYSLHYCVDAGDGIREIVEIPPRKDRMTFFDKYTRKCDDYAVRLSYEIDLQKFPLDKGFLEFNIMASHSLSNTVTCKKMVYKADNIQTGVYETGKSMRIIVSSKHSNGAAQQTAGTAAP